MRTLCQTERSKTVFIKGNEVNVLYKNAGFVFVLAVIFFFLSVSTLKADTTYYDAYGKQVSEAEYNKIIKELNDRSRKKLKQESLIEKQPSIKADQKEHIPQNESKSESVRSKRHVEKIARTFSDEKIIEITNNFIKNMSHIYKECEIVKVKNVGGRKTLFAEIAPVRARGMERTDIVVLLILSGIVKNGNGFREMVFDFSSTLPGDDSKLTMQLSDAQLYQNQRISLKELMKRVRKR